MSCYWSNVDLSSVSPGSHVLSKAVRLFNSYRKTSNIRHTFTDNKLVDHSDVVGASPVGAALTTSSFSTQHLVFNGLGKDNCKTRQELFKFWYLVRLILEVLRYHLFKLLEYLQHLLIQARAMIWRWRSWLPPRYLWKEYACSGILGDYPPAWTSEQQNPSPDACGRCSGEEVPGTSGWYATAPRQHQAPCKINNSYVKPYGVHKNKTNKSTVCWLLASQNQVLKFSNFGLPGFGCKTMLLS